MSVSVFDSEIFGGLFGDPVMRDLMSDAALIRAMLHVEGHLAQVQGALGLIPSASAEVIFEASQRVEIPPSSLASGTVADGLPVPAFVSAFRAAIEAPEHAQYVHWGATSQDILDTGLVLRLRDVSAHLEGQILALLAAFGDHARMHRDLPMAARTRNQVATPTSFGARVAVWGSPFLRHLQRLTQIRARLEVVSFAGASGNLSALGARGPEVADALADSLGLHRQTTSWHAARDTVVEYADLMALIAGSAGKFAQDLLYLGQSELREVRAGPGGGSSTMAHKSNPVAAETIVALSRMAAGASATMAGAMIHGQDRDGAAWAVEWHALPQAVAAACGALGHALELAQAMVPDEARMMATIEATNGLMFAEAATFALAGVMPRPEAQALVKDCCRAAASKGLNLRDILQDRSAAVNWDTVFSARHALGAAPEFADRFAASVADLEKSFKF